MSDNPDPPVPESADPPWPTLHPADEYDGERGRRDKDRDGASQLEACDGDRRMHEQLEIANNEKSGEAST